MNIEPLPKVFPGLPKVLFTDFDETLTWQGKLPWETFHALYNLKQAGIQVIPVTGACAGWCDCLIRTWPIDAIIGENGSFSIDKNSDGRLIYAYSLEASQREVNWQRLQVLKQDVLERFSVARQTADQAFRLTDIAFDINQDHQVDRNEAFQIAQYCMDSGLNAKISSIHINVWCGDYSKASMANDWLDQHNIHADLAMFSGDSPNDDSMFANFELTVGVANIKPYLAELDSPPAFITSQPGGYGFVELAESLLESCGHYKDT